jgi:hypothetical protein
MYLIILVKLDYKIMLYYCYYVLKIRKLQNMLNPDKFDQIIVWERKPHYKILLRFQLPKRNK